MCRIPLFLVAASFLWSHPAWAEPPQVLTLMILPTDTPAPADGDFQPRRILSLETPDSLPAATPLAAGPSRPAADGAPSGFTQWQREIPQQEAVLERGSNAFDQLFERVGNVIDTQDIEGPLGTLSTVHFLPPVKGNNVVLPFLSLSQDADELDAHLRLGVGTGATWRIDQQTSLNAEVEYLESAGDVNPATSSETRFMLTFIRKF